MLELGRSEIQQLCDLSTAAAAIKDAYIAQAQGRVQAPPVTYLGFDAAKGDCHVKTGHIAGTEGFVIKIATGFYDNPAKGLPSSNGMNLVFSADTGQTLALLKDEGLLTDVRTGLGGAIATKALARPEARRVLVVGAGLQCLHQIRCLSHVWDGAALQFAIWARDGAKAEVQAKTLRDEGLVVEVASELEVAVLAADVIVTTTPSKTPLIQSNWVQAGTHVTAIGADSPGKQELATALVARADVRVCDLAQQSLNHGEFQSACAAGQITSSDVVELGHVLAGAHPGRQSDTQITIADLTGLAAQDAAISLAVLRAAQAHTV